jgi:hypothetical protein
MKPRSSDPQVVAPAEADREERARLVVALRNAGPDLEPMLITNDQQTTLRVDCLDDARTVLLARLHRRSNDFSATTALKALDTFSAARLPEDPLSVQRARHRPRTRKAT